MNHQLTPDSLEDRIIRRIPREILLLSIVFSIVALFLFDLTTSLFILAGGALSALNFIWLKQTLSKFLLSGKKKALKSALAFYTLRLVLILAIFFIIIDIFSKKIIAFAAGFSMIVLVFLIEAGVALSRMKKWKS